MVKYSAGQVVALEVQGIGRRPAVVVANTISGQCIVCQITAEDYGNLQVLRLAADDFEAGSLVQRGSLQLARLATIEPGEIKQLLGQIKKRRVGVMKWKVRQIFFG